MNLRHSIRYCILAFIFVLPSGCERDEFNWGTKVGSLTYSGNVVFLGAEDLVLIKDITDDRITFSGRSGGIEKISGKSILVIGVSEKTPYGALRKVNTITANGNEVILTTTDAELADAIKDGTISFQKKLLEKDFRLKSLAEGVYVQGPAKSFDGLAVTLDSVGIFSDGTHSAFLEGAIGISPEIGIAINLSFNELNEIDIFTDLNKIDEITVTSNAGFSGSEEILAAEFIHSPIVIDSLVFVPEVGLICGFEGGVSTEVSTGVRQDRSITSRMNYSDSRWAEEPLTHNETFDFSMPLITDDSDLKIFSGPEITIRLFGSPVQVIRATGYFYLEAEKAVTPAWKLSIGSDGHNSLKAGITGLRVDHILDIAIQASEIGNAGAR